MGQMIRKWSVKMPKMKVEMDDGLLWALKNVLMRVKTIKYELGTARTYKIIKALGGLPLIDLEEAEREVIRIIKQYQVSAKIKNLILESSDLKEIADPPFFKISGAMDIVTKPRGIFSPEKTERRYFTAKVHALIGKVLTYKMYLVY